MRELKRYCSAITIMCSCYYSAEVAQALGNCV